jgi:hypothetical protein
MNPLRTILRLEERIDASEALYGREALRTRERVSKRHFRTVSGSLFWSHPTRVNSNTSRG